jgi:hypothetical protein
MTDHKRPSFMPEVREFSQADARVIQRPEGLDAGGEGMRAADLLPEGRASRYAEIQASPGGWWEGSFSTIASISIGGVILLCDSGLGFPAHSILVDNWTNQWLYIDAVRRFIPPYTGGWVLNAVSGTQQARIQLLDPSGAGINQLAIIAGEYVWVGFAEAMIPAATGVGISATINPNGSLETVLVDDIGNEAGITGAALGAMNVDTVAGSGRTYINATSGNQANANAVATLPAAAGVRTWITGFEITALGATALLTVLVTVTGLAGAITFTYVFQFPLGVGVPAVPLIVEFPFPIPSNAVNTAIVVTCPASGLGGADLVVNTHGFQE